MRAPTMAEVNRERVLLIGGQRALLMQLAHPLVAAGVAEHSDFPARALDRLRRTLELSLALIYGSDEEADAAASAIRAVHERVRGTSGATRYSADDPRLLLWVNATLIDTTMLVYERFVRPLSREMRDRYYAETVEAAAMFGIPRDVVPADLGAFERYLHEMLEGEELRSTDAGRRLARDVLHPPLPLPLRPPTAVVRRITVALLPERIREIFGLSATGASRAAAAGAALLSRAALPWIPPVLREFSRARAAGSARIRR